MEDSPPIPQSRDAELLATFEQLIECIDHLLAEQDQFSGRLRRTSIFTSRAGDDLIADVKAAPQSGEAPFRIDGSVDGRIAPDSRVDGTGIADSAAWRHSAGGGAENHA